MAYSVVYISFYKFALIINKDETKAYLWRVSFGYKSGPPKERS